MIGKTLTVLFPFVLTGLVAATPLTLVKRTLDGTCGGASGYICDANTCCSQWGWCGFSDGHCGAGCQPAFGRCDSDGGTAPPPGNTTPPPEHTPPPGGRPRPGNVPYGQIINSCTVPGTIALTFDDGPYIYTNQLLDLLKKKKAKATFFVNGMNWGDIMNPDNQKRIRRMRDEGHQIASHTNTHPDLSFLSYADIQSQMTTLEASLVSIIGKYPTYMRPPYLSCSGSCPSALNDLGYHIIQTDLDTKDYENDGPVAIETSKTTFRNAVNSKYTSRPGFIVLAHDVHQYTVTQLAGYMIDYARSKGWRVVTVGECLGDPAANWYRTA